MVPVLRWLLSVSTELGARGGLCAAAGSMRPASLVALKCQAGTARWASTSIMHLVGRPPVGSWQSTRGASSCFLSPHLPPYLWAGIPPRHAEAISCLIPPAQLG